jgi:hypothetical protein
LIQPTSSPLAGSLRRMLMAIRRADMMIVLCGKTTVRRLIATPSVSRRSIRRSYRSFADFKMTADGLVAPVGLTGADEDLHPIRGDRPRSRSTRQ